MFELCSVETYLKYSIKIKNQGKCIFTSEDMFGEVFGAVIVPVNDSSRHADSLRWWWIDSSFWARHLETNQNQNKLDLKWQNAVKFCPRLN